MKRIVLLALLLALGALALWSMKDRQAPQQEGKLYVAASFYPMYFFASHIAGDKADVFIITPAGTEPHDYELTAQDLVKLEQSDMLILNGGIEPWTRSIQDTLGKNLDIVVAAQTSVGQDAHFWLNPELAKEQVQKITDGFIRIDPGQKETYMQNQRDLNEKLDALDAQYREALANCRKDSIVTSHTAFGYLANRYAFDQVSIAGLSPDHEPSPQDLVRVSKFVKDNDIEYIFFETLVSPKLSETIAQETGAKTLVLDPIEGINQKNMEEGKDYFTLMEENLKNLGIALKCTI